MWASTLMAQTIYLLVTVLQRHAGSTSQNLKHHSGGCIPPPCEVPKIVKVAGAHKLQQLDLQGSRDSTFKGGEGVVSSWRQVDGCSFKELSSQPQQQLWLADCRCQSCGECISRDLRTAALEAVRNITSSNTERHAAGLVRFVGRVLTWISTVPRLLRGLMEALASLRRAVARMRCISRARTSLICSQRTQRYGRLSQQEMATRAETT